MGRGGEDGLAGGGVRGLGLGCGWELDAHF